MVNIILLTLGLLFFTIAVIFVSELITGIIRRLKKKNGNRKD